MKFKLLKKEIILKERIELLQTEFQKSDIFTRDEVINIFKREIEENKEIFGELKK
jgi:hypothetical protein